MTTKVFIAGSIAIKHLDAKVKERIDNIVGQNFQVFVGDADGADTSIQTYLSLHGAINATVYFVGKRPRNNVGHWPSHQVETTHSEGSRAYFTAKDLKMAEQADIGLMIWDTKSTGTLSNVIELLARRKKAVVWINKAKVFVNVATAEQLEDLIDAYMSPAARDKAEQKIRLSSRIRGLSEPAQEPASQLDLLAPNR